MKNIEEKIEAFKKIVIKNNHDNPAFKYREWFVGDHLEIVEKIAKELCNLHPEADRDLVMVLAWFHDFGNIIDLDNKYEITKTKGTEAMRLVGFEEKFIESVLIAWEKMEKKNEIDISKESIEVQIISSADGASHFVGLFHSNYFRDDLGESLESIRGRLKAKMKKDWERKIVLPEVKKAFRWRYLRALEIVGEYPERFIL